MINLIIRITLCITFSLYFYINEASIARQLIIFTKKKLFDFIERRIKNKRDNIYYQYIIFKFSHLINDIFINKQFVFDVVDKFFFDTNDKFVFKTLKIRKNEKIYKII